MASEADTDLWEVYLRHKIDLFSKTSVYDFTPEGELFYAGGGSSGDSFLAGLEMDVFTSIA